MPSETFQFKAKVWVYDGPAPWHFVTLPKRLSARIKREFGHQGRGFGSLRVSVRVGQSSWQTSIFPDKQVGYVLPLKAAVRKKEGIKGADSRDFEIRLLQH
jgi:hypothetical protein